MIRNAPVVLGDHFSQFVDRQGEAGRDGSANAVIRAGLRLPGEHETRLAALRAALIEGDRVQSRQRFRFRRIPGGEEAGAREPDRMRRHRLSRAATRDLSAIWDHADAHRGEVQADRHVGAIRAACEALANGSRQPRPADAVREGYMKHPVGSHMLSLRRNPDGTLLVVRILHQRMDPGMHV
jgi:toxin ParE1/3/4